MGPNQVMTFWLILVYSAKAQGFSIIAHSQDVVLTEGDSLTLLCQSDGHFEFCDWRKSGSKDYCKFEWKRSSGGVKRQGCSWGLRQRMKYTGNYGQNECKVHLQDITLDDAGQWICEVEQYSFWNTGTRRHQRINLNVQATPTTTSTTTTTTTTTTTITTTSTTTTTTTATTTTTTTTSTTTSTTITTTTTTTTATTTATTTTTTITTTTTNTTTTTTTSTTTTTTAATTTTTTATTPTTPMITTTSTATSMVVELTKDITILRSDSNTTTSPLLKVIDSNQKRGNEMPFTSKIVALLDSVSVSTNLQPDSSTRGTTSQSDQANKVDTSSNITESSQTLLTPPFSDGKYLDSPQEVGPSSVAMDSDANSHKVTPKSSSDSNTMVTRLALPIALIASLLLMSLVIGTLISCWKCSTKKEIYRFDSEKEKRKPSKKERATTMQMSLLEYDEQEDPELNPPSFRDVRLLMSQPCHSFEEVRSGSLDV
ncbi:uncharacterized protein LOC131890472 [Tigriopus californicus]|uniref:uncharacterized protein LOC131890472 n=1 Tax=Tigriopus californicus TaxID=6832 RepID=UPI0027DAB0EB|nr:uncharacterized protein LOC131890472 [Tigriopus californicus]